VTEHASRDWIRTARYVRLVTFRRDGAPVATPVWFAFDADGRIVVYSAPDAGKVKRVRNNARVEVAPCTAKGVATGPMMTATAIEVTGPLGDAANRLLTEKYPVQKRLVDFGGTVRNVVQRRGKRPDAYLSITLD
jgi:uncharacterized protein